MNHPWHVASLLAAALLLAPVQAAQADPVRAALKKSVVPNCDRENFRVILDVGHSAEVPGAMSARGVGEYTFNLNLANVIQKKMLEAGFTKTTVLISSGKAMPSLVSRVHYAGRTPADLFLSIHHDAVPDKFLEKWTYEGKERPYCDRFKGHSLFVSAINDHYKPSLQFAKLLGTQLKSKGLQYATQYTQSFMGIRQRQLVDAEAGIYRFDNLVVLMSTNMPAVLFEAGSIINRDEELVMANPEHQAMLATSVTTAVEGYCKAVGVRKPQQRIARSPNEEQTSPSPLGLIGASHPPR
jgi:N-acetylmuramoyl-L-alanine amidase